MLDALTAPELTLVFLAIVVGLGTALIWALWEFEQMRPKRNRPRATEGAPRRISGAVKSSANNQVNKRTK